MKLSEFFRNIGYVTLKTTNGCNLKCDYCNVEALTPQTPKMSMDLFKQVARLLIENSEQRQIGLEFHGGEPLLLSDEWFEEAVGFARDLAKVHRKHIEFPLVTNATLLTPARLKKLHELGIQFCVSCDGPPEINDILRAAGNAVERAFKLLQDMKIYHGIITVLSPVNYNRLTEVMDWYQSIGIRDFRVNFMQPQGRGIDSNLLSGEQMFEGMKQVFEHMLNTNVAVHEADMATHVRRFINGRDANPGLTCWEVECQAGRTYVAVDLIGRIHACGTDIFNHPIGHVDKDLDDDHYKSTMQGLHEKGDWVIRCFDCPARRICNHSCPTSDYNSELYKENECQYTKLLWNYFCDRESDVRRLAMQLGEGAPTGGSFVPASVLEYSFVN